jgi:NAD(P)H-nitrite reductase large subunit
MNNLVESLDDDSQINECNDVEKQFVITSIEIELAEMISVNGIF